MAERVFAMPDLGEGLQEGEIVTWLVAEGVTVELNQPLVEIETAKATVEVPSPFAGVVERLHGAAGDVIAVGAPLVTFSGAAGEVRATPPVRRLAASSGVDLSTVAGSGPQGRVLAEDVVRAAEGAGWSDAGPGSGSAAATHHAPGSPGFCRCKPRSPR